ncbi:SGM_3592 family protein [Streptomyces pacificus]
MDREESRPGPDPAAGAPGASEPSIPSEPCIPSEPSTGSSPADGAGAGGAGRGRQGADAGRGASGSAAEADPRGDDWDEAVLDEDFVRAAETTEPSARARMLAARWRGSAPEPQPWRSDEPPAGWFWSRGRARRGRRWWRRS